MKLGIVGTGAMGQVLLTCAKSDPDIGQIFMIEPTQKESWPDQKLDLLIDFSHPHAICGIYEYCRARGGNIPVVLATTGYNKEEEEIIHMLQKICPVDRRANFSQGIAAMNELAQNYSSAFLGGQNHIALFAEAAPKIDMSNISAYDQGLNESFQGAFKNYFDGNATIDEAKAQFESIISEKYPELVNFQWPDAE